MQATPQGSNGSQVLLEVRDLKKHFLVRGGVFRRVQGTVRAVDGVSFTIRQGETLGLIGESGCGKTTVGRTILRLIEPTGGEVIFDGKPVFSLQPSEMKALRQHMQVIFQDPYASLDPRQRVGKTVAEGLIIHGDGSKEEVREVVFKTLRKVGLETYHAERYPHEFSGGQRQRIGIARAVALQPKFIICDEPVSALDVSIQAQVLNLLVDLKEEFNLTYLFIAHNMSVIEHISDRIVVMYLGKIVETASRDELFRNPLHPYTQALMSAIPRSKPGEHKERTILPGDVPSPLNPPSGCSFHPRCPLAFEPCPSEGPPIVVVNADHWVRCWLMA